MKDKEYFGEVSKQFDLNGDLKAAVLTAQTFISMGLMSEEQALTEFKLTKETFDKFKELPQS